MADVFEAMARTQGLGTDTDAEAQAAQTTLQPAIRAIARAFARGDATGMTSQTIVNLAEWTGLDTAGSAWMEDPSCNWVVTLRVLSLSAVPGVSGRLEMTSKVPLQTNVVTGQVSGSARMDVTAQMQSPPPCTVTFQPATTDRKSTRLNSSH